MSPFNELKLLARTVPKGTSRGNFLCPFCNGGSNKDHALSISHRTDGVVLFMCHRAKCKKHGRVFLNGRVLYGEDGDLSDPLEFVPRFYDRNTRLLLGNEAKLLEAVYGLSWGDIKRCRLSVDVQSGRLCTPIFGPEEQLRGVELRWFPTSQDSGKKPKTEHFKELNEQWLGWFHTAASGAPIVIVEDVISAIKVSRQFVTVAALSSHLSLDDMMEICKYGDNIALALDKDATKYALKLQQRFKYVAPNLRTIFLQRDLKYDTDPEIRKIIQEGVV